MSSKIKKKCKIDLAVCVLFFEKAHQTIECIKSFQSSGVRIYILNNGSSSKSREVLGQYCEQYDNIVIFDSSENLGVSGGRNFLVANSEECWLLFVDNDIYSRNDDWLEKIESHIASHPEVEVFIPRLYNLHEKKYNHYSNFAINGNRLIRGRNFLSKSINNFPGGASFVNRKLFNRLGLYDEQMFVGFEDFEFAVRGIKNAHPVSAVKIEDMEFIHDHRMAKNDVDKKSILIRYDREKHRISMEHLSEKHGLIFEDNWEEWINNQVNLLVHGKKYEKKLQDCFFVRVIRFGYRKIKDLL